MISIIIAYSVVFVFMGTTLFTAYVMYLNEKKGE